MRPHSAKPGRLANFNLDEFEPDIQMSSRDQLLLKSNQLNRSRMGRLSGNEHARVMPTNFYHDNEHLYSQAIKLKQRTNATLDENVKLKTRITLLEKENSKLMRVIEQEPVKTRGYSRSGAQPPAELK